MPFVTQYSVIQCNVIKRSQYFDTSSLEFCDINMLQINKVFQYDL